MLFPRLGIRIRLEGENGLTVGGGDISCLM
jgi:hypothetical protein